MNGPVEDLVHLEEEGDVAVQLGVSGAAGAYEEHATVGDGEGAVDAVGDVVVGRGEAVADLERGEEDIGHLDAHEEDERAIGAEADARGDGEEDKAEADAAGAEEAVEDDLAEEKALHVEEAVEHHHNDLDDDGEERGGGVVVVFQVDQEHLPLGD